MLKVRKQIISKLSIEVVLDIPEMIEGSSKAAKASVLAPKIAESLRKEIDDLLSSYGFTTVDSNPFNERISQLHGGYSTYRYYFLETNQGLLRLVLDTRIADHLAKPDYSAARQSTLSRDVSKDATAIKDEFDVNDFDIDMIDVVFKERGWGLQYFVGGSNDYSNPVDSKEGLMRILNGKIAKLVAQYS